MKQHPNITEKIVFGADLSGETIPGVPLIEIAGESRVLIENHCGVTVYSCNEIKIRVSYGYVCLVGRGLQLAHMSRHRVTVVGVIEKVVLDRRRDG